MMRKHIRECDILLTSIQDNKEWGERIDMHTSAASFN